MNKSSVSTLLCALVCVVGYVTQLPWLLNMGLFAFSGAITNWLAVHMLFEKVPFIYGSGVIQLKFSAFKDGIRHLIIEQFFAHKAEVADSAGAAIDAPKVADSLDMNLAFDKLVEVIEQSQFGSMLGMFGGRAALEPMRDPFAVKMREAIVDTLENPETQEKLMSSLSSSGSFKDKLIAIVDERLDELTPAMVKDIVQTMIREHLGWLVVWGGVFGALIGLLASFI